VSAHLARRHLCQRASSLRNGRPISAGRSLTSTEGESVHKFPKKGGHWRGKLSVSLLLVSLLLPFAQIAIPSSDYADAALPACCRTHGKHKCAMRMLTGAGRSSPTSSTPQTAQISERCPYVPAMNPAAHGDSLWNSSHGWDWLDRIDTRTRIGIHRCHLPHSLSSANRKRGPPPASSKLA